MVNNCLRRLVVAQCCLCGGDTIEPICKPCLRELPWIDSACTQCGLGLPDEGLCGQCLVEPPPFTRCIGALEYRPPISHLIGAFKYQRKLHYGRLLSLLLAERVCAESIPSNVDALVPVPLHWRRRWSRGFNQAEIIGDELSRALTIPLRAKALIRRHLGTPQQDLSAAERRRNLRGNFETRGDVRGLHLALVDDVVTTGATASEITRTLLDAGAASVQVWCLARTP
jgi:ComF family protein